MVQNKCEGMTCKIVLVDKWAKSYYRRTIIEKLFKALGASLGGISNQ